MDKNYSVFDFINLWEEDLNDFERREYSFSISPSKEVINNILAYANFYSIYSPTFKNKIELCLN
jgi:hypothetical protein